MTERPPLPDIDYTAAVEAAAKAVRESAVDRDAVGARIEYGDPVATVDYEALAAAAVDAVWPILHPAAYAQGREHVLGGAVVEYAVVYGDGTTARVSNRSQAQQLAAVAQSRGDTDAYAAEHYVTEWRPIVEGRQP